MSDLLRTIVCRTAREWEKEKIKIKPQVGERKCREQSERQTANVPTRQWKCYTCEPCGKLSRSSVWPLLLVLFRKYLPNNKRWGKFQNARKYAGAATSHTNAFNEAVKSYGKIHICGHWNWSTPLLVWCRTADKLLSWFSSHSAEKKKKNYE